MTEIQLIIYPSSWLEHLTVNQRVLGSSPRGGASNTVTLHILNLREIGGFFFYDLNRAFIFLILYPKNIKYEKSNITITICFSYFGM